jgi:integrase
MAVDYLDKAQIQQVTELLKQRQNGERHSLIWLLSVNTGLRISDVLPMTMEKLTGRDLKMQKTKKNVKMIVPEGILEKCREFAAKNNIADNELLFGETRKRQSSGFKIKKNGTMTRQAIYKVWSEIGEQIGVNIGCHSSRKSFGRLVFEKTKDIVLVARFLGHTDITATFSYIGLTDTKMQDTRAELGLIGC